MSAWRSICATFRKITAAGRCFHRGDFNISASVKAYFALKCVGDDIDAPHMVRAREAILKHGGAEKSNVFTRIQLALFGAVPWRAVPVMPVEIMLLPRWFPFHLSKVSYWSRTVIVPLLVLMAKKPRRAIRAALRIDELFVTPPEQVKNWHSNDTQSIWNPVFRGIDAMLRVVEPLMPTRPAPEGDCEMRRLGQGTPEWRRRPWRDLSGDGQYA